MLQVKRFILNPFQENTYIIYDQTGEAIIIDPGCYTKSDFDEVKWFIDSINLKVKSLYLTHGHIDHILGIDMLKNEYKVQCIAHADDIPLIETSPKHGLMFGLSLEKAPTIDGFIKDGDKIVLGNSTIEVIHTPGHSLGGVCFYLPEERKLITGDTLFNGSIGRTDLPGGNYETLIKSILSRIIPLGDKITIYPGHGDDSTIGFEKNNNPFLKN